MLDRRSGGCSAVLGACPPPAVENHPAPPARVKAGAVDAGTRMRYTCAMQRWEYMIRKTDLKALNQASLLDLEQVRLT